jgi:hypothetical protein
MLEVQNSDSVCEFHNYLPWNKLARLAIAVEAKHEGRTLGVTADCCSEGGDPIWQQLAAKFNPQPVSICDALRRKLDAGFEAGMSWLGSFSFRS